MMLAELWMMRIHTLKRVRTSAKVAFACFAVAICLLAQSPKTTAPPLQPLPYSHKTHIAMGLKCQACHTNPEPGEQMTFPSTTKCMACHQTIAADRPAIQKLSEYHRNKEPVPWVRVYRNPDWIWFSHRVHIAGGAKCETCHGPVAQRDALWKEVAITMESCMNCHRENKVSNACTYCHEGR